jgi:ribonuclease BN (tRNA processing enzyme)
MNRSKIIFLGTAGDALVTGKQVRASAGIIIEYNDDSLYLDPGPGTLVRARQYGINLRNLTAILISHNHMNHANDVNAVISSMTNGGLDPKGVLIGNKTLFKGNEFSEPYLRERYKEYLEKSIELKRNQKVGINDFNIQALETFHTEPDAIGFKIKTNDFTIVYSGDTAYDKKLIKSYDPCDILILNVPNPGDNEREGHLNSKDAIELVKNVSPNLVIITHFGVKMLSSDPLYEAREIHKETGIQVMAATDGMVIDPQHYSTPKDL